MAFGENPVVKGMLVRVSEGHAVDEYRFQYNPGAYKEKLSVDWSFSEGPGQYLPVASFGKFGAQEIPINLFLDGREVKGQKPAEFVLQNVARLQLFASPGARFSERQPQFVSPGTAMMTLGSRVWTGVVSSVEVEYIMFDRNYDPIRATVTVVFSCASQGLAEEVAHLDGIRTRSGRG